MACLLYKNKNSSKRKHNFCLYFCFFRLTSMRYIGANTARTGSRYVMNIIIIYDLCATNIKFSTKC